MKKILLSIGLLFSLTAFLASSVLAQDEAALKQQLFKKVFGDAVRLDPQMCEKVLSATPGEFHYVDSDGDGRPEEVWFIDLALRHPEEMRPLLVRAIDEDGDLESGHLPDIDSDLYVADWKADGTVDCVLDYTDVDKDNDLDEMGIYFFDKGGAGFGEPVIRIWWGRDEGDDNLLWHDVGYNYNQALCQYRTHFGGDEFFVAFALTQSGERWIPFFENPFLFYDHDGDGVTEEVLRLSGKEREVDSIRHSFDVDNDATWESPRDFDASLTAHAPEGHEFGEELGETMTLRGIPTGPFLKYAAARGFVAPITWERMMLTWDENDHNVDGQRHDDDHERWEGVIAHGNEDFKQVGGPSCGPVNKRFELVLKPQGPARFYYHPLDRRVHLRGADKAWMEVDLNFDGKPELRYDYLDTDEDGVIDRWTLDVNMDGEADDRWRSREAEIAEVGWNWPDLNKAVSENIEKDARQLFTLNTALGKAIRYKRGTPPDDPITDLFRSGFQQKGISTDLARKFLSSNETLRFYLEIHRDILIYQLKECYDTPAFWFLFNPLRSTGDYVEMRKLIYEEFKVSPSRKQFSEWRDEKLAELAPDRVAWAEDWVPPNIGWESDKVAYRAYWGQFDFFGKKTSDLIYPTIGSQSYHEEMEWGIDALYVGKSGGCGGVTLYVNGEAYPVRSPEGKGEMVFEKRFIAEDDEHVTIEMLAKGVGPSENPYSVRFICSALAGRPDTPVKVTVEGGKPGDEIELGVGLIKLPQEEAVNDESAGVLGSWGSQDAIIGTIGMGIVYPVKRFVRLVNLPDEHQVVLKAEVGQPIVYHIQCDWLNGRRFDRSPSAGDWLDDLRDLAKRVALK